MKAPKVSLRVRIRRADGKDAYVDPAWNRNRTLRAGYAVVNGKQEYHPEGVYYLRFKPNGRGAARRWMSVGAHAELAIAALRNVEHELQAVALGKSISPTSEPANTPTTVEPTLSLTTAIKNYLADIEKRRSKKTISACTNMLNRFARNLPAKLLTEITRDDLLAYAVLLEKEGLGKRTVYNHIARIETFLRKNGIVGLLAHEDRPDYDEKAVSAYNEDELKPCWLPRPRRKSSSSTSF